MELIFQITAVFISLLALYYSWSSRKIARSANEISEKSNQIAEDSNQIANEAKDISEKSFKIEEQKIVEEAKFRESEQKEKIRPFFKHNGAGRSSGVNYITIKNIGYVARNLKAEISSIHDHKITGKNQYDIFKSGISQNINYIGTYGSPFTLNLSFEDNEKNGYEQVIKFTARLIDDDTPPQLI